MVAVAPVLEVISAARLAARVSYPLQVGQKKISTVIGATLPTGLQRPRRRLENALHASPGGLVREPTVEARRPAVKDVLGGARPLVRCGVAHLRCDVRPAVQSLEEGRILFGRRQHLRRALP
jgi:hypothetical protein